MLPLNIINRVWLLKKEIILFEFQNFFMFEVLNIMYNGYFNR